MRWTTNASIEKASAIVISAQRQTTFGALRWFIQYSRHRSAGGLTSVESESAIEYSPVDGVRAVGRRCVPPRGPSQAVLAAVMRREAERVSLPTYCDNALTTLFDMFLDSAIRRTPGNRLRIER